MLGLTLTQTMVVSHGWISHLRFDNLFLPLPQFSSEFLIQTRKLNVQLTQLISSLASAISEERPLRTKWGKSRVIFFFGDGKEGITFDLRSVHGSIVVKALVRSLPPITGVLSPFLLFLFPITHDVVSWVWVTGDKTVSYQHTVTFPSQLYGVLQKGWS